MQVLSTKLYGVGRLCCNGNMVKFLEGIRLGLLFLEIAILASCTRQGIGVKSRDTSE